MIGLPFRILSAIAIALFFSSKWVRRTVAAVVVSALIVVFQNPELTQALAAPGAHHGQLLRALSALAGA
ncbi:hypothetical protein [Aestuariivirga sp.]|uniref:hypothetical protein n=1 Tax=Aestuariivirga sp. TaxID=2650926 RepID=UPI0025C6766B|nr:hypothetical protein [Aestuariivirga sp.]MCA3554769.1 hypothetical protein [Aestuariivirga sp.]